MGNEVSGLVPSFDDKSKSNDQPPSWLNTSFNNVSFGGNAV